MANFAPARLGRINSGGGDYATFLKVFSGEVLSVYNASTVLKPLVTSRTIQHGASVQFPKIGRATSDYHTPGVELLGTPINQGEVTVLLDLPIVSHVVVSKIDEAMNHYDVRAPFGNAIGTRLAQETDIRAAQTIINAARTSTPTITGDQGGSVLSVAALNTDATILEANIIAAAQLLDEKNIPAMDRYCVLRPQQWWLLLRGTNTQRYIDKQLGGEGSLSQAVIPDIGGVSVIKSNNLPSTVVAARTGDRNTYAGDFTKTFGAVFTPGATAHLRLMGLSMESEYSVRHQSTMLVGSFADGNGVLQPECAVELRIP